MDTNRQAAGASFQTAYANKHSHVNYTKNRGKSQSFNRDFLPTPANYYSKQFANFRIKSEWVKVQCPFHDDHSPSLNINMVFGGFKCFVCGARGGDVLAFQMQRYHQSFKQAAITLGAWRW